MGIMFKDSRKELRLDVHRAVVKSLGLYAGTNYKKNITLVELIDSKFQDEIQQLKYYTKVAVDVTERLKEQYPFLDLENFNLSWTGNELEKSILNAYDMWLEEIKDIGVKVEKIDG